MAFNPITGTATVDSGRGPGFTWTSYPTDSTKQAVADVWKTLTDQPSAFANTGANMFGAMGNAFTGYGQGLTGLANAQTGNYGAYSSGLGNLATAYANQASSRYGANAMAEAARQGAVGNIGSAALGAYGNIGGQALQAWGQNQMAYNKSMSDMLGANQYATSQLGQSRNSALAGLGNSYAAAAAGLGPSTVASNLNFNFSDSGGGGDFGGGGFSATGAGGPIGSGSYGGGGYGGGGGMQFSGSRVNTPGNMEGIVNQTYGGLGNVLSALNDDRYSGPMNDNYRATMGQLNDQHYSSRAMPSQMMDQGLTGLTSLGGQAYGTSNRGMDQFYREMDRSYDPSMYYQIANQLGSGYRDSSRRVSDYGNDFGSAWESLGQRYGDTSSTNQDLYRTGVQPLLSSLLPHDNAGGGGVDPKLATIRQGYAMPTIYSMTPKQMDKWTRTGSL